MRYFLAFCFVFMFLASNAAVYYVSSSGNDSNPGTNPDQPWKSLTKVNRFTPKPGDQILFKRGDTWRAQLSIPSSGASGNYITYGAYGTGDKPRILGSEIETSWTNTSGNIWKSASSYTDPYAINIYHGNIYFVEPDGAVKWGRVKKETIGDLAEEFDWTWHNGNIHIYSPTDPNTRYLGVEISQRFRGVTLNAKEYIAFDNLEIAYASGYGIHENIEADISGLIVKNCHIHHLNIKGNLGYGISVARSNTLFQSNEIHNCGRRAISLHAYGANGYTYENHIAEYNTFYDCFHTTGVDIGTVDNTIWNNIIIRNNYFYHSPLPAPVDGVEIIGSGFMYCGQEGNGSIDNVYIYNNIYKNTISRAFDIGNKGGPDHCYVWNNTFYGVDPKITTDFTYFVLIQDGSVVDFKNNIFYNDTDISHTTKFSIMGIVATAGSVTLDNNLYYNTSAPRLMIWYGKNYSVSQLETYKSVSGQDANSILGQNPLFVSPSIFHLQTGSPAINAGVDVGLTKDFEGNPIIGLPDIGAYQYASANAVLPNAPGSVVASAGNTSATITFVAPENNGGSAITGYIVTSIPSGGTDTNAGSTSLSHTITGLTNGTSYTFTVKAINSAGTSVASAASNPVIPAPQKKTEYKSICQGEDYLGWSEPGEYQRTFTLSTGGDSIVATILTVNPSYDVSEDINILEGESYLGWSTSGKYKRTLTSLTGCDSIVTTNLTVTLNKYTTENISICEGSSYNSWSKQGQYERILQAASGADSIVVTNLWITPVKYSEEEVLIVQGESYNGWFDPGEYQRTLPAVSGCDSIVTTVLTVVLSEPTVEDIYICEGSSYQSWTKEGQYERTLTTASGADSVVISNLWITPINYTTQDVTIKEGESYKGWTKSGVYEKQLSSQSGCDSIVIINMTVLKSIRIAEEVTICEGSAYHNWSEPGLYQRNLIAASGADSIVTTILSVNPVVTTNEQISIVKGDSYMGWSVSGTYSRTLSSIAGCDSIVVTDLNVTDPTKPNPDTNEITQSIELRKGWNLVSAFVAPENPDMAIVKKDLIERNSLIKVQDERGRTFEKWSDQIGWVNNIGDIQNNEGYSVHVRNNCTLEIIGQPVSLPLNITLKKGWNLISFPYSSNVNSTVVMQQLIDAGVLIKVQDEVGYALEYWGRSFGWMNRLGHFKPGEGYLVKVKRDAVLTIGEAYEKSIEIIVDELKISHFTLGYEGNGFNHMNINIQNIKESGLQVGDEIAAFDNEVCVGAITLSESNFISNVASIAASASDSGNYNGFVNGHPIELRLWNSAMDAEHPLTAELIEGEMTFSQKASVFITLSEQVATGTGIDQYKKLEIEMFPNPATEKVTIRFSQMPLERTQLFVFDLTGKELISREVQSIEEILNIQNLRSGLYIVKTIVGNTIAIEKLIVQ